MTMPPSGWRKCGLFVGWWEGEYEGWCELRQDHPANIHFDGMSWYNDGREDIGDLLSKSVTDYLESVYGPPKGLVVL
jgi:hypothetical protein